MNYHQFSLGVTGLTHEEAEQVSKLLIEIAGKIEEHTNVKFEPQSDGEIVFIESFEVDT